MTASEIPPPDDVQKGNRNARGHYLKGHKLGGRPYGSLDFRKIVFERAIQDGYSIEDALYQVFKVVMNLAKQGDLQAAKLLIDKLCDQDAVKVQIADLTDEQRAERIEQILQEANERRDAMRIRLVQDGAAESRTDA